MQLVLLITLAVIALLCKTTDCQGNGETSTIVSTRTFVKGECGTKTYICDSCTSRQPCIAGQEIEASFPCASGTFCNEGTAFDRCGPTPSAACVTSTETASFTCTSTGVIPDPNNCNNYHVCLTVGASSTEYNCPPGYVFSIASSSCIRQMTAANCVTVACTPRVPSYVLYGTSRVYYAICDGVNRPTQILRCPNGALFTYFSNSSRFGECVYTCSGQGNYPNSNNPSTYFQCYISSGRLVYNEIDCPQNTIFNQTLRDLESNEEQVGSKPSGVTGALVNESNLRLAPAITGLCDGTKQLVCETCNSFRVCLAADLTVTCPADQPYCNYGTTTDYCSSVPIPTVCNDETQDVPVACSAVGIVPDARNCRIYHGCTAVGQNSQIYSCPTGYVFNAALELCALENVFSRCVTLQCTANYVGHVRYGQSLRFYGLCDGTRQTPIVYRCPNRANFAFITGTTFGECAYVCPAQGNFPNSNDPQTYFQCFWANRRLRYNLVHCPTGLTFNTVLRYCSGSPVLVLVANGSDITINFPGENNNNRLFSFVSSSGNNNPSMYDWIGGNGANKAPSITLGKSNALALPSVATDDDSAEESNLNTPSGSNSSWGPRAMIDLDETDVILPVVTTVTPAIPTNTTISGVFSETIDKV
uniref:Chitin-binding type-2 domain-containing protein n=1 Tax=Anopheles dirus TaxID=7168 RepID=A0A182NQ04_9DIPT